MRIESISYIDTDDIPWVVPANRFRTEDALTDPEGNQLCPVFGCCSLRKARMMPAYGPYYLVCPSGCTRKLRHRVRA